MKYSLKDTKDLILNLSMNEKIIKKPIVSQTFVRGPDRFLEFILKSNVQPNTLPASIQEHLLDLIKKYFSAKSSQQIGY